MLKPSFCSASTLLLTLGLSACGGGGGGNTPAETNGTFSLSVTDAPVDNAQMVLVQFTGVTVKPNNGDEESLALSGDSQTCEDLNDGIDPRPTPDGETTVRCIELKALQGTQSASLLDGELLAAGEYNWMRLDVDAERGIQDSIIVLDDGGVESLYIPSGNETGLKLNSGFTVLAGGSHDFVVDFDLRKSVNNPQGFPDYILKPSLRLIDLSASGNITGTVEGTLLTADGCSGDINELDGYSVYIYAGGAGTTLGEEGSENAPLTSAGVSLNDESGLYEYTAGYLTPGEYTAVFTCQAADDSPEFDGVVFVFVESADSPTMVVADEDSVVNFGESVVE